MADNSPLITVASNSPLITVARNSPLITVASNSPLITVWRITVLLYKEFMMADSGSFISVQCQCIVTAQAKAV